MIPIEWKYTEDYGKANKAQEDGKGDKRLGRYSDPLATSGYLKSLKEIGCKSYAKSEFFVDPKSIVDAIEKTGKYNNFVKYLNDRYNYWVFDLLNLPYYFFG